MRKELRTQIIKFGLYVVFQLFVLHRFVLWDAAYAFFYVGYLLLLPPRYSAIRTMTIAFGVGILIDLFSNTPGIQACACVILAVLKYPWLVAVKGAPDDSAELSFYNLGLVSFTLYVVPLIFLHLALIFFIENGSFSPMFPILKRVIYSTVLNALLIGLADYLMSNRNRRS